MIVQRHPIFAEVLALACFFTANLVAQVTTGQVSGVVVDPSRAAVSDAVVTVRSLETNATRKALTTRDGWFSIPELSVGVYEVSVEKEAFARFQRGPIVLRVSENAYLRIQFDPSRRYRQDHGYRRCSAFEQLHEGWQAHAGPDHI